MHRVLRQVLGVQDWCVQGIILQEKIGGSEDMFGFAAKSGTQVIVPYRDEDEKRHLKVMGDLGQIVPMVCSA